jgi:hypothetical protein
MPQPDRKSNQWHMTSLPGLRGSALSAASGWTMGALSSSVDLRAASVCLRGVALSGPGGPRSCSPIIWPPWFQSARTYSSTTMTLRRLQKQHDQRRRLHH